MTSWEFPAEGPVDLQVRIPAGSIAVTATPTQTISVRIDSDDSTDSNGAARVELSAGELTITAPDRRRLLGRSPGLDVAVIVPPGSRCGAVTASADITCRGDLGGLRARTASGDVTAGRVLGETEVSTSSGDVRLERCVRAWVKSVSGDIWVGGADGGVDSQSVSGDIHIGGVTVGEITANTTSGDITITVVPGTGVRLDLSTLSGDASSELRHDDDDGADGPADATLTCRSISGDVTLRRAV